MHHINKYTAFAEHAACRILVCEGSSLDAIRLVGMLEDMGYTEVTSVSEVRMVIPALLGSSKYDSLLIDLRMPNLEGLKLIYIIRRRFSAAELPILALIDEADPDICNAALLAGANDYLVKPIDAINVALRVRNLLTINDIYSANRNLRQNLEREISAHADKLSLLIDNGLLMSMTRERSTLIRHTLFEGQRLLHCDAASMYLVTEQKTLRFAMRTRDDDLAFNEIPLFDAASGRPNEHYVATYCTLHKKSVRIDDVYQERRFDLSGTRSVDAQSGYRTVSLLSVPMVHRDGHVVGVLQFINKLDAETQAVIAFHPDLVALVEALAAQAAMTLDNWALNEARQAQEEASGQLRHQIAQLDRQRSIENLSASLGHELNQPLTAILTNAQVAQRALQSGKLDTAQHMELLDKVILNTRRASQIVERIRGFIRPSVLRSEPVALHQIVLEVVALVADEARNLHVSIMLPSQFCPVRVQGDPIQLSQVLLNMLRNAMDAVDQAQQKSIHIAVHAAAGRAIVHIRDSGPGLSSEGLSQAGMPFFTTKPSGLGLGISISRNIASQLGGTLTLANAEGAGALVELSLPELVVAE
jgi:C4-dicarboxylate-specific signal transduction histidine kinase